MGITILRPKANLLIPDVQVWSPLAASASGGWWDNNGAISGCVAAYAAKGAANLAASYINLANPYTYNAAPVVAPTWDATGGWTFNGTSQYLTTGVVPNQAYTMIVRFSDVTNNGYICGQLQDAFTFFALSPQRGTGSIVRYAYATTTADIAPGLTSGVLALAGPNRYRNGSTDGSFSTTTWTGSVGIHIGAGYSTGAVIAFAAAKIQALTIYSVTLTAGQVATLTTLMNAL